MGKPSLMDGFSEAAETETESGADSGAAFEELRKRFLNGDPEQAKDAFAGLVALCDEDSPAAPANHKPALHISFGH
jgi:hypothetical protein